VDAVILAAGRGSRAIDAAEPFMKPLLVVDGLPLVARAAYQAQVYAERVVVVAAPQNARQIVEELNRYRIHPLVVVQSQPRGPGHALLMGLFACRPRDDRVLVMIGSDLNQTDDVAAVSDARHTIPTCVGVRFYNRFDAERFTFLDPLDDVWREKQPPRSDSLIVPCWVGMFVGMMSEMQYRLTREAHSQPLNAEIPIGPFLRDFMCGGRNRLVITSSKPIKTAEDYKEVISDRQV
jgi:hypothetical protein